MWAFVEKRGTHSKTTDRAATPYTPTPNRSRQVPPIKNPKELTKPRKPADDQKQEPAEKKSPLPVLSYHYLAGGQEDFHLP